MSSCPGLHANMELTSNFSLFDEISHLFVKKRKGKMHALLHNMENGFGVASFRQKENAQVTWVWSSWCTRTDLVLGCSPKQVIPAFFPRDGISPENSFRGGQPHTPLTQASHPDIFQGTSFPLPRGFCSPRVQKKGTKTPISREEHPLSDVFVHKETNMTLTPVCPLGQGAVTCTRPAQLTAFSP